MAVVCFSPILFCSRSLDCREKVVDEACKSEINTFGVLSEYWWKEANASVFYLFLSF